MGTLRDCIAKARKAGMKVEEARWIKDAKTEYIENEKYTGKEAEAAAVDSYLKLLLEDEADIIRQIEEQGGVVEAAGEVKEPPASLPSEAAKEGDAGESVESKLKGIAERIGVKVIDAGHGFHAGGSEIYIPDADVDSQGVVSRVKVFAHELAHAIMQKRGISFKGFPKAEALKYASNYDDLIAASKAFRPEVHQHENDRFRRHAMKPDEILADSIASVLIGEKPISLLAPLMKSVGLTERDMGLTAKVGASDTATAEESSGVETKETDKGVALYSINRGLLNAERDEDLDPSTEESQEVQAGIEGKTPQQAAQFIIDTGSELQKVVAQKVLWSLRRMALAGIKLDLKMAHVGDQVPSMMAYARGMIDWSFAPHNNRMTVWINGADVKGKVGTSYVTVLHELIHMATSGMIHMGSLREASTYKTGKDVADLIAVTDHIRDHFNRRVADSEAGKAELTDFETRIHRRTNNALDSADEVLAWGLSNPDAQAYMETIPYPAHESAWSAFVSAIRRILGIPEQNATAFTELLRVADNLMSDNVNEILGIDTSRGFNTVIQMPRGEGVALNSIESDHQSAVSRAIDRAIALEQGKQVSPLRRVMTRNRLNKLRQNWEDGKLTQNEFIAEVEKLHAQMEIAAESRRFAPITGRARGADFLRQKLLEAKRRGDISEQAADMAEWFILKNPALVDDLGIGIRAPSENQKASGNYNPLNRVMTLFKESASDTTAVHEILHHLERMMPAEMQADIRKEWLRAVTGELQKATKAGDQKRIDYFTAVLSGDQKKATELLTGKGMEGFNSAEFQQFDAPDTSVGTASLTAESARLVRSDRAVASQSNPADKARMRGYYDYMLGLPSRAQEYSKISVVSYEQGQKRAKSKRDLLKGSPWIEIDKSRDGGTWKWNIYREGTYAKGGEASSESKADAAIDVARVEIREANTGEFNDLAIGQDYQYLNPSEFWAVRMTNTMAARFEAKSIWARSLQWLKEALEHIKGVLGLKSDHPLLRALDGLIARGNGEFVSKEMLGSSEVYASIEKIIDDNNRTRTPTILSNALDLADSLAGPSVKTLGSLNNVVTQLHKARNDPKHFGPVFNLAMAFRTDLSRSAYRSWEMAKDILPAYDDIRGAVKTLIHGRKGQKEIARAATMLFEGTTYGGGNPLAGMRWTHQQLKDKYQATAKEIELYDQARAAIDSSLTEVSNSIAWKLAKPHLNKSYKSEVINNAEGAEDAILEALELAKQSADEDGKETIDGAIQSVNALYEQAYRLKAAGYTPLSRFGRYTVDVFETGPDGKIKKDGKGVAARLEFKKFDFEAEARAEEKRLRKQYAGRSDVVIKRGVQGESRLFAGVDPETVALFVEQVSEIPGLDIKREVLDEWRREAVSQRSAITHSIKRKGIAGYSEDLPRVLATFLTSNARYASANFHMADMMEAINDIPDSMGDVKDDATTLYQYINANNEPGAWMRGLMFAWYLGGSPAAAAVNMTQPVLMTLPYLQQFGNASKHLLSSVTQSMKPGLIPMSLRGAMTRAMEEGIVEAQEIHHLYAEGMKPIIARLPGGEGLRARAQSAATLWGAFFGMAENFNRRISFLAAYKMAEEMGAEKLKAKGFPSSYAFARRAVEETQGVYAKENRPNWARGTGTFGAVGVAAFTFKQFSIQYVELLTRMYRSGPEGKAAAGLMLGLLILASGLQGVPGADDLDDLIDTIMQSMGYRGNVKKAKRDALKKLAGERMADIVMYGLSAETPIDVQARLGLGNILPATGLFKPSEQNKAGQIAEFLGPPGGMAKSVGDFIAAAQSGQRGSAFAALSPVFVRNVAKAYQMLETGEYKDTRGRKVEDVDAVDAAIKGFGFQPQGVASAARKAQMVRQDIAQVKDVESDIASIWAQGMSEKKPDEVKRAREMLKDWNEKNPETPIRINLSQILKRVHEMKKERSTRLEKTAPKEMRGYAREGLN